MTIDEIAEDLCDKFGLQIPLENQIGSMYGIGTERQRQCQAHVAAMDKAHTKSIARFGRANLEPLQEWKR